ncbi:MAG: hemolysin family protein [Dysgonamonadaceae bacterium]|jgi:CBS domain containing-hemolysin-like protein|nr:hemolysin family protein [Dysgonamonadaceae bacterium]
MPLTTPIIWLAVFLFLSAFVSGIEVAFVYSDKLRYALDKKSKGACNFMLDTIYGHSRQFMATLTVGNLLVLALFIRLGVFVIYPFVSQDITANPLLAYPLVVLFISVAILFTGEFIPRLLFRINPNLWVKILVVPAFVSYVLLYPLTAFFISVSKGFLRLFGIKPDAIENEALGRVDLDSYLKQGIEGTPDETEMESEVKIFRNALDFSSVKIRDCMIPRAELVAVSEDTDYNILKDKFIETGLSRILVYKDNIDNIVGYIHVWEIFDNPQDWTKNIAGISFVPESMQANKLMSELMQQRKSITVVVDEFGGTSGIVTMEDLVEEIFGDIEDEYDVKAKFAKQESENEYVLAGRIEIDKLNEMYDLDLPESDDYSTVAGLLLHHTQRFPKTYETIVIGKYTFKVLKVTARKIEVLRLEVGG